MEHAQIFDLQYNVQQEQLNLRKEGNKIKNSVFTHHLKTIWSLFTEL